jgi:hypothetical protein
MMAQPRFRLLVVATAVLLALVLLTSQCGSDGESAGGASPTASTSTPADSTPETTGAGSDAASPVDGTDGTNGADDSVATTVAPRPGDPAAPLADPKATGQELAQRFLNIVAMRDPRPALQEFLSPSFQLQRSNGTYADRDEYLDAPASVVRATIRPEGFRAYQDGAVLTVRFSVDIQETVSGEAIQSRQGDRLAVFRRGTDGWKLVAWANFNPA